MKKWLVDDDQDGPEPDGIVSLSSSMNIESKASNDRIGFDSTLQRRTRVQPSKGSQDSSVKGTVSRKAKNILRQKGADSDEGGFE